MSTQTHNAEMEHAETEVDPRIGRVLQGRYQILERVAAGGMGVVYRGERLQLGRPVAIKFLHATFAVAPDARKRFEREAMATARLSHPNCVSVFDIGVDDDGSPYIVMEYLLGQTLRQVIQQEGRLQPGRALYIASQILGALAYAHSQDMIHRDIKPANILLSNIEGAQDHVFILDFGLAKVVGSSAPADITRSNVVLGTPSYMSPEQARGEPTAAPSDVYSTGILLFEMLTGQKLFRAVNTLNVLMAHQHAPVPRLSARVPEQPFSEPLEAVVKKALAKPVAERYATAAEFAEALAATPEATYKPRRMSSELPFEPRAMDTGKQPVNNRSTFQETERLVSLAGAEKPASHSATTKPARPGALPKAALPKADEQELSESRSLSGAEMVALDLATLDNAPPPTELPASAEPGASSATPPASARIATVTGISVYPIQRASLRTVVPYVLVLVPVAATIMVLAMMDRDPTRDNSAGKTETSTAGSMPAAAVQASQAAQIRPATPRPATPRPATPGPATQASPDPAPASDSAAAAAPVRPAAGQAAVALKPGAELAENSAARAPEPPRPRAVDVNSIADVEMLIRQGQREEAIRGIQKLLRSTHAANPYLHYLLGNLYFDKVYWGDGLEAYMVAAKAEPKYRKLAKLNENAIRALSHDKARDQVSTLYLRYIRRAGLPFLKQAARSDKNPIVRKRAQALVNQISRSR